MKEYSPPLFIKHKHFTNLPSQNDMTIVNKKHLRIQLTQSKHMARISSAEINLESNIEVLKLGPHPAANFEVVLKVEPQGPTPVLRARRKGKSIGAKSGPGYTYFILLWSLNFTCLSKQMVGIFEGACKTRQLQLERDHEPTST